MIDTARDAYTRSAVQTLHDAGYTYHGGERWIPPLGPEPPPRIAELEAAVDAYLAEFDNPVPDYALRRQLRDKLRMLVGRERKE